MNTANCLNWTVLKHKLKAFSSALEYQCLINQYQRNLMSVINSRRHKIVRICLSKQVIFLRQEVLLNNCVNYIWKKSVGSYFFEMFNTTLLSLWTALFCAKDTDNLKKLGKIKRSFVLTILSFLISYLIELYIRNFLFIILYLAYNFSSYKKLMFLKCSHYLISVFKVLSYLHASCCTKHTYVHNC